MYTADSSKIVMMYKYNYVTIIIIIIIIVFIIDHCNYY